MKTMRAVVIDRVGGPEVLTERRIAVPVPAAGQVRVRHSWVGLNFVDVYNRTGLYSTPTPFVPGMEAGGVIDAIGPSVSGVELGDRVAYVMELGAYAEAAVIPAWKAIPVPDILPLDHAVAVALQGMTAQFLATAVVRVGPGAVAVVHAAAGGVGSLLVQALKLAGVRVIGTTSNREKADRVAQLGAEVISPYRGVAFAALVRNLTDGRGADVVFDSVGQETWAESLRCLRPRGTLVLYGQSSGPVPPIDPQLLRQGGSLFLTRPTLTDYSSTRDEVLGLASEVFNRIIDGRVRMPLITKLPFHLARDAHVAIQNGNVAGKILFMV